jgi:hypothetical protein
MPVLSAANVLQAKTGSSNATTTAPVALDNPTTPGGTVIVEINGPTTNPVMPADGWELDYYGTPSLQQMVFRYSDGPGGETSWTFTNFLGGTPFATAWHWRVTEWDLSLDPVSPLEAAAAATASGTGVATLSTGTTSVTNRAETVALAWHMWRRASNTAQTFDWSGHTNGFVERDEIRLTQATLEFDSCWSWAFTDTAAAAECTATVNLVTRNAGDNYYGMVVVYAADQPIMVDPPMQAMSSGGGQP